MKFAVSNIAWAPEDRVKAYAMLGVRGISGLEIAPGLFFEGAQDVFVPDIQETRTALSAVRAAGLELVSMQSLLFGVNGAALFGAPNEQTQFIDGMERAIVLAGRLEIPNIVFGSPRQRVIPSEMNNVSAMKHALSVFSRLGDLAYDHGTSIAIEANPPAYGTNFLNDLDAVDRFVRTAKHPAISICLDLGAMHMNGDFASLPKRIPDLVSQIGHVHVSEPALTPAPADPIALRPVIAALAASGYERAISIEMARVADDASLAVLNSSLNRLLEACA